MQWRIGHIVFNQDTNVLTSPEGETLLEPKTAALLSFFIENQGRDISRDELMEHVWHGNIVSENAINRVVVRLRKALGDEEKVKQFIVTVPKLGYRFIATAEPYTAETAVQNTETNTKLIPILSVLAISTLAGFWFLQNEETISSSGPNVSPLVRLSDEQFSGATSNDGTRFVYSHANSGHWLIYLTSQADQTPKLISPDVGRANSAVWSPDDAKIAYQYIHDNRCEFRIHTLAAEDTTPDQVIYECTGSYAELVFSKDGSKLYFTERENQYAPDLVYELDLTSNSKRRLSQPPVIGKGNYSIDRHPTGNDLLVLSAESGGATNAYKLTIEDNSYEKIHAFDYSVDHAIWGHKSGTIVHMGEHPSYELVETDLSESSSTVLVSDSRRITEPKRINNGKDYLFRSFLYNRDIAVNGVTDAMLNSSVRDYLPSYNHTSSQLAFISKRAGYSQVWIKDFNSGALKAITVSDKGRKYYDLKWSFDDRLIAAATDAGILIINPETGLVIQDNERTTTPYAIGWNGSSTVHFSHYEQGQWQSFELDTVANEVTPLDEKKLFILADAKRSFYLDSQLRLRAENDDLIETPNCAAPITRLTLHYQLGENSIYCLSAELDHIIRFDSSGVLERLSLPTTSGTYYSPSPKGVAVSVLTTSSSDIMRTNFEQ